MYNTCKTERTKVVKQKPPTPTWSLPPTDQPRPTWAPVLCTSPRPRRRPRHRRGVAGGSRASATPPVLKTLVGLARLGADTGKREKALELLAFAMQQSAIGQAIKEQAEDLFSELGAAIPPEEVRALKTRAQSRALGDVVAEVLKNIDVGPLSDPAAP